jgi:E3 ubiquitin-protein ligase DOA10
MKEAVMLPCKHIFHEECIRQWIIKNLNNFCPKCKRQFNFDNITEEYRPPVPQEQPQQDFN